MHIYQMDPDQMGTYGTECIHALIRNLVHEGVLTKEQGDELEQTKIIIYRQVGTLTRFWKKLFKNASSQDSWPIVVTIGKQGETTETTNG